ncbi:MAG: hemolysin family protein [Cyclonatronaceae bacterium]
MHLIESAGVYASVPGVALDPASILVQLIVILAGLVLSALFSSSEVAYFSLAGSMHRGNIQEEITTPGKSRVMAMLEKPRRLLVTILIGNTFANILTAVFAAVLTGAIIAYFGLPELIVYTIEVLVLTFVIAILTEITPKILAMKDPMKVALKLSGFLYIWFVLLAPVTGMITFFTRKIEKSLPTPFNPISSHDIKTIAEMGEKQGTLRGDEREIIENVIEFGNTTVKEIMTSRVNIVAVSTEDTMNDVLSLIREKSISRMPLYEGNLDHIVGIIHSKDLLPYISSSNKDTSINWKVNARRAFFIPATKKIDDLLKDFQREKTHIAIVVDEYGGTEGMVTLDDVLEEILGELQEENGSMEMLYTRRKDGDYLFDAQIDLDDMADILGMELTTDQDEYETLGGLIYHLTERIPEPGEKAKFRGLELTVAKVDNNRVKKVRVHIIEDDEHSDDITGLNESDDDSSNSGQ